MLLDTCLFGDVRDQLRRLIDAGVRVNAIVTSPPYWGLRSYCAADDPAKAHEIGSEPTLASYLETMVEVFELCRQVLKDTGTAWINMGDSYASGGADGFKPKDLIGQPWRLAFALQDAGWWLRQDIVWSKPAPMPESVRDRFTKSHEFIFLMTKAEHYYFDQDAVKEPASLNTHASRATIKMPDGWDTGAGAHGSFHREGREKGKYGPLTGGNEGGMNRTKAGLNRKRNAASNDSAYGDGKSERMGRGAGWRARKQAEAGSGTKNNGSFNEAMAVMPEHRNRRDVWSIASEPYSGAHFATFPKKLVEPCILAGCPPGGVVLDPFFGSGTTGEVAQALGRHYIGIELNRGYEELQYRRLRQLSLMIDAPVLETSSKPAGFIGEFDSGLRHQDT